MEHQQFQKIASQFLLSEGGGFKGSLLLADDGQLLYANPQAKNIFTDIENGEHGGSVGQFIQRVLEKEDSAKVLTYRCGEESLIFLRQKITLEDGKSYYVIEFFVLDYNTLDSTPIDLVMTDTFDKITECFYDSVYVTHADVLTLKLNKGYECLTGIKREEVIGEYMSDIVKRGLVSVSATERTVEAKNHYTYDIVSKAGRVITATGVPLLGEDTEVKMVVFNVRDITELTILREELNKTKQLNEYYKKQVSTNDKKVLNGISCESQALRKVLDTAH